jgi:beta-glucanase (GH16 family)
VQASCKCAEKAGAKNAHLAWLCIALAGLTGCWSPGHVGPPVSGNWVVIPELTDEFRGNKLDASKWNDCDPGWKGRQPGLFSARNVGVSGGELRLTARVEDVPNAPPGYHTFTTAAVKSKATVLYGYFEIRCKPMRSRASSGFWFNQGDKEAWTEIDVFEVGPVGPKHGGNVYSSAHVFRAPGVEKTFSKPHAYPAPFDIAGGYHVYGLLWEKDRITWYVDGSVTRQLENTHWHRAMALNLNSETKPNWFGLPEKSELPATFSIDYARAWRRGGVTPLN